LTEYINAYNDDVRDTLKPALYSSGKNATMFIFSPRYIPDHYKRPLVYNFNYEFMENAADHLLSSKYSGDNPQRSLSKLLISDISNNAIVPSIDGTRFNTSQFSDLWSFVLIVTNDDINPIIKRSPAEQRRNIYIGLFSDEPINPNTINMTNVTINPNATLIITRKIILNRIRVCHPKKGIIVKDDLMADVERYYHNNDIILTDDKRLFNIQPNSVIKNFIKTDNSDFVLTDYNGFNSPVEDIDYSKLETIQHSPKLQLKTIGKAILSGLEYYDYESMEHDFFNVIENKPQALRDNASAFIENNTIRLADNIGLKEGKYKLSEIINIYNPNIFPIIIPPKSQLSIIPQNIDSPTNIFSSLVANAIPSFLIRVGLSGVSFMYNSYYNAMKLLHIELINGNESKEVIKRKWDALYKIMQFELFQIIENAGGPFDLMVNSFINGSTYIKFHFLDDGTIEDGVFEENNMLGGITSPCIGNFDCFANNAKNLNGFIEYIGQKDTNNEF